MSPDIRVKVDHLSKKYKLYRRPFDRFREWFSPFRRTHHQVFWALRDVNLEVSSGEALGIIGENGAGKSTLLKIISGTSYATTGEVAVQGRVTALLELGSGFHPEFSGRENLILNARLMGLSDEEIRGKMAEVIEFAELGDFIDQPVRTYSSGMQVRLGFAVASSVNPDVLIVDEALGVGDAYFQKKSLDRVRYFRDRGLTFLFVTHALPLVQRFCTKCLWLREGKVEDLGDTSKVVRAYQVYSQEKQRRRLGQDQSEIEVNHIEIPAEKQYVPPKSRWGNGRIKITRVEMVGEDGRAGWVFNLGEKASLRIHYETAEILTNAVFSFQIERIDGIYVMGTSNADNNVDCCQLGVLSGSGMVEYEMDAMSLHAGTYFLSVQAFAEPDEPYWTDPGDCHFQMYEFRIHSSHRQHGVVALPGRWKRSVTKAESLPWV